MRAAPAAAGFTLAGWLYLALSAPMTDIPFGQRSVPSPLVWPAAAAVSTMLLSRSELAEWEVRAPLLLWPYRLGLVVGSVVANLAVVITLTPAFAELPLLTWFAALQALALGLHDRVR